MSTLPSVDNSGETDYAAKIREVADVLQAWRGPVVLVAHVDPDGDALGSTLALKRALGALGKETVLPLDAPRYLSFLADEGELAAPLERLPEGCLLAILDVADEARAEGAPLEGAAFTLNIDHHGTNARFGDLACVEPSRAATAHIVKDVIGALGVTWTEAIATPCLTGILTDTGNLRFGNTTPETLRAAGELIAHGVPLRRTHRPSAVASPRLFQDARQGDVHRGVSAGRLRGDGAHYPRDARRHRPDR